MKKRKSLQLAGVRLHFVIIMLAFVPKELFSKHFANKPNMIFCYDSKCAQVVKLVDVVVSSMRINEEIS